MATVAWGIVKDGLIVPHTPLPEGARVEIRLADPVPEIPPELQAEFNAWDRASAEALRLVAGEEFGEETSKDTSDAEPFWQGRWP